MKKNIINKIFAGISLLCLSVFLSINDVIALTTGNGESVPTGDGNSAASVPLNVPYNVVGIRLSLVTSSGTTVFSKDYYTTSVGSNWNVLPGACNKIDYASGSCNYNGDNWRSIGNIDRNNRVTGLDQFFNGYGLHTRIQTGITSENLSKNTIFGDLLSGGKEAQIKNAFSALLGADVDASYKLPNGSYNLFLEWEALGSIQFKTSSNRYYYVGTTYELSKLSKESFPGYYNPSSGTDCRGSANGGFCNVGIIVDKKLGCMVYLDPNSPMGNLVATNIDTSVSGIGTFTQTSYFNGLTDLNQTCDQTTNVTQATSANSARGMGVIWLSEMLDPNIPSCQAIYDFYGGKKSATSPYTALYINGATSFDFKSFNDANGTNVDTNWFKAVCPCVYPDCPDSGNGYNCTPEYYVPSCEEGGSLIYKDSSAEAGVSDEYWQRCIFTDYNNGKLNQYDIDIHKWAGSNLNPNDSNSGSSSVNRWESMTRESTTETATRYSVVPQSALFEETQGLLGNITVTIWNGGLINIPSLPGGGTTILPVVPGGDSISDPSLPGGGTTILPVPDTGIITNPGGGIIAVPDTGGSTGGSNYSTIPNNGGATYYDDELSTDYCEVYCIEDVFAQFDSGNPTVLAGYHFVWGWSTVNTTRTCKTKSINYSQFASDLSNANQTVLNAYAASKLEDEVAKGQWKFKEDDWSDYYCPGTMQCPSDNPNCSDSDKVCSESETRDDEGDICEWDGAESYSVSGPNGMTGSASIDPGTITVGNGQCGSVSSKPDVTGTDYGTAIENVESILKEIELCYTFGGDDGLVNVLDTNSSKAFITYKSHDGTYNYGVTDQKEMKKNNIISAIDKLNVANTCTQESYTALDSCSGDSCSDTSTTYVYNCNYFEKSVSHETTFTLEDGIYQYVLKNPVDLTLKSIYANELERYKNSPILYNWLDIGYSNFPVPYNTADGKYEGTLEIKYYNLGHDTDHISATETDVDYILRNVSGQNVYGEYSHWTCGYTVDTDLIPGGDPDPDPGDGDINVIYREIDLARPFPDTDASNRATGANWCDTENCAWNNAVSTSYILQNRDVTGDEVYSLEPMYTFIMTPSDVLTIRRYNDQNTYSSYTGNNGSSNYYDFECIEGTGMGCRSEYLTELMNLMEATNLPGTCKNERGIPKSVSEFEACRY